MPGRNDKTPDCNTLQKHARISIFKIPKSKSGIAEHKNEKKNLKDHFFFLHEAMF